MSLAVHRILALGVLVLGASSIAGAQSVSYSQGTFNIADWSRSIQSESPGMNSSVTVDLTHGNPGSVLVQYARIPGVPGGQSISSTSTNINTLFTYNPATNGAITALTFGFDLRVFAGFAAGSGGFYRPAIRQNGLTYGVAGSDVATPVGSSFSRVNFSFLPTDNWNDPLGTSTPDFSGTGGVIDFGYRYFVGAACNAAVGITCNQRDIYTLLDNYDVSITAAPPLPPPPVSTVPEPSTYVLMAAGLAGVFMAQRRRRPA